MSILDEIQSEIPATEAKALSSPDTGLIPVTPKPIELSPQQQKIVSSIEAKLDFRDANAVLNMDSGISQSLSAFNETALKRAKVSDMADIDPVIVDIINKAQSLDPTELRDAEDNAGSGFLKRIFGRAKNAVGAYMQKYESADKWINEAVRKLNSDMDTQKKLLDEYPKMFETIRNNYNNLKVIIFASRRVLDNVHVTVLPALKKKAEESDDGMALQDYNDAVNAARNLEVKIENMERQRSDCIRTILIVGMMQKNSISAISSIQNTINDAVSQFKTGMMMALTLNEQKKASVRESMIRDASNEMRKKVAMLTEEASVMIAENSERPVISYDAIEFSTKALIRTMDRVRAAHEEGRRIRNEERQKIENLDQELKSAIISDQRKSLEGA